MNPRMIFLSNTFQKDYEKAERLLVTVMQRLISLKGTSTSDDAIVELSLKMASIQAATGQQEKADLGVTLFLYVCNVKGQKEIYQRLGIS